MDVELVRINSVTCYFRRYFYAPPSQEGRFQMIPFTVSSSCNFSLIVPSLAFFKISSLTGDHFRGLGRHHVFCTRRTWILELDLFCYSNSGKSILRLSSGSRFSKVPKLFWAHFG